MGIIWEEHEIENTTIIPQKIYNLVLSMELIWHLVLITINAIHHVRNVRWWDVIHFTNVAFIEGPFSDLSNGIVQQDFSPHERGIFEIQQYSTLLMIPVSQLPLNCTDFISTAESIGATWMKVYRVAQHSAKYSKLPGNKVIKYSVVTKTLIPQFEGVQFWYALSRRLAIASTITLLGCD